MKNAARMDLRKGELIRSQQRYRRVARTELDGILMSPPIHFDDLAAGRHDGRRVSFGAAWPSAWALWLRNLISLI
jgi:hypothetical protein